MAGYRLACIDEDFSPQPEQHSLNRHRDVAPRRTALFYAVLPVRTPAATPTGTRTQDARCGLVAQVDRMDGRRRRSTRKRVKRQALRIVRAAETQVVIVEPGEPFPHEMCSK